MNIRDPFDIDSYNYELPEDRIARFPLEERSDSRLLIWNKGTISHDVFKRVESHVPKDALLVLNNTRVIAARMIFKKESGAQIEIFLLHPVLPTKDISASMAHTGPVVWSCMIGNKKKWKEGTLKGQIGEVEFCASFYDHKANLVEFRWTGGQSFAEIVNAAGATPLPPYLKRPATGQDVQRYQTVYSALDGAVAAPTAGLHFTDRILQGLRSKGTELEYLTLHVSAGTFKPVDAKDFRQHNMHSEQIIISRAAIEHLLRKSAHVIAVGTTSLRILESLYWYGVVLAKDPNSPFMISMDLPYKETKVKGMSFQDSLQIILKRMHDLRLQELRGETEIYIYPGYHLRTARGLFTNFHLPKSTLLLLISVFTSGQWRDIYSEALSNDYRFLSYGDSSLLLR